MTTLKRWIAISAILVTTVAQVLAPSLASAQVTAASAQTGARTKFLADRLKYPPAEGTSDDFRVRTNAALALGQSNDENAVEHLCRALEMDPSEVVRQAVAAAIKRLSKSSALSCLKQRATGETSAAVRLQITRAIEALEAQGGGSDSSPGAAVLDGPFKPKLNPSAKYYVSISSITNNTERSKEEISKVVLDAIRSKIEAAGPFQLAPDDETPAAAKTALARRKLKGYHLAISVDSFDYTGGNLRVRMKCAVFTYPNKDLRGHFTPGATQQGVRKGDRSSEDNLLSMVASAAVDQFAQSVDQFASR